MSKSIDVENQSIDQQSNQRDEWTQAKLEGLIRDKIGESRILDYKAADALAKDDKKITAITKAVSAMANADGGVIIYGIKGFQDKSKKIFPEKLDPIDQNIISEEWLEHAIANIQPRIPGLRIYPVEIKTFPNHFVYAVEIPRGTTAHQANDYKYYMRYDFQSVPMNDQLVKDVINRINYSDVTIAFALSHFISPRYGEDVKDEDDVLHSKIHVVIKNAGNRIVNHYKVELKYNNVVWTHESGDSEIIPLVELPSLWNDTREKIVNTEIGSPRGSLYIDYHSETILFPQEEINIGEMIGLGYLYNKIWGESFQWKDEAKKHKWTIEWKLYADR